METTSTSLITQRLVGWSDGDPEALEGLMQIVSNELRRLANHYLRSERPDHTLQPTALVHEAYLRLTGQNRVHWQNRAHFFGVANDAPRSGGLRQGKLSRQARTASQWLNDNHRLLFYDQGTIHMIDLGKRGKPRKVFSVAPNTISGFKVSPDARMIYFGMVSTGSDIWLRAVE